MKSGVDGPLRIGLVGGGKMAVNHARAIARTSPVASLVALADPSERARQAMAELIPGLSSFSSLDDLLANESVDVVHVCTPPATHAELGARAVEAGCHVYIEKPFVESVAEAERLLAAARRRGLQVAAGHQLLFESPTRRSTELLPSLGRLVHCESYFSFRPVRRSPGGRVPLAADLQLLDVLPHPVYLLLHFLRLSAHGEPTLAALQVGEAGAVHALIRQGDVTGTLIVTLQGRPVESYIRLVGTNGSVHADYVRGTVQRLIGPGTSGIDKALAPYQLAGQLLWGTSRVLSERLLKRQRSYPGLVELFDAFYGAIRTGTPSPISSQSLLDTTRLWEKVAGELEARGRARVAVPVSDGRRRVLVTGGTGFLGQALVRALTGQGIVAIVAARREPPIWERVAGAEYRVADLARPLAPDILTGVDAIIHAAAETAGGWEEHQRNSLDATEHVLRAASAAGVGRVVHVSSLAVLAGASGARPLSDDSPLEPNARALGPYVWGKLESERLAVRLGRELGLRVKVIRPGALVDYANFDPPGRLGRRLGNLFVAVGSPSDRLGITEVDFAAHALTWMMDHFDATPDVLNLLNPDAPTKRQLLERLRRVNPDLKVVWLPRFVLVPLSVMAVAVQKAIRPRRSALSLARIFSVQRYDTRRIAALAPLIDGGTRETARSRGQPVGEATR